MIYSADTIFGILLLTIIIASTAQLIPYIKLIYAIKVLKFHKLSYELSITSYYYQDKLESSFTEINPQIEEEIFPYIYLSFSGFVSSNQLITTNYKFSDPYTYSCKTGGCSCSSPGSVTYYLIEDDVNDYYWYKIWDQWIMTYHLVGEKVKGHV